MISPRTGFWFPATIGQLLVVFAATWVWVRLGLHPSFDAKPHRHWPVLQRPTSASGKAA